LAGFPFHADLQRGIQSEPDDRADAAQVQKRPGYGPVGEQDGDLVGLSVQCGKNADAGK
jgi:hypothetical protein